MKIEKGNKLKMWNIKLMVRAKKKLQRNKKKKMKTQQEEIDVTLYKDGRKYMYSCRCIRDFGQSWNSLHPHLSHITQL